MPDTIWQRVDDELRSRRDRHQLPGTWADMARVLKCTDQVVNNWKRRGVPPKHHAAIATAFGWTLDRLVSGADRLQTQQSSPAAPPPAPPPNFADRHDISDSDFATLQAVKGVLSEAELAEIRARYVRELELALAIARDAGKK